MKKTLWILLVISLAGNLLALGILDRTIFYKNKISVDETAFYNQGLRTSRSDLIKEADYKHLGILLGGNLVRYWYLPADVDTPLVNLGSIEEKVEATYAKLKQVVAELSPGFVIINAGFCQIHTAVHAERNVDAAISGNLEYLRKMVAVAKAQGTVPILTSLSPVRATHLLPYTGLFERSSVKKDAENSSISEYNAQVRTLASDNGIPFLDFHNILANEQGQLEKEYAVTDGEHLNQKGYQAVNAYLRRQIEKLLAEETI